MAQVRLNTAIRSQMATFGDGEIVKAEGTTLTTHKAALNALNPPSSLPKPIDLNSVAARDPNSVGVELANNVLAQLEKEPDKNFLHKMSELIREILYLTQQISEKDRKSIEDMKVKYHEHSAISADSLRSKGNANVIITAIAFVGQFVAVAFKDEGQQKLARSIAEQIPTLGTFFTLRYDARQTSAMNELTLLNTEMQNIQNNQSSQSGWKDQVLQQLTEVKQWLQKASNPNA